jgi:hypothetical protein
MLGPKEKAFLQSTLKRWQVFASVQGEGEQAQAVRAKGVFRVAYLRYKLSQNEDACTGCGRTALVCYQVSYDRGRTRVTLGRGECWPSPEVSSMMRVADSSARSRIWAARVRPSASGIRASNSNSG